ncbi:MAG: NAD-dependent epimerase/dehydratase family protein [Pseudomonadota bacterium]|nr:NAD-dependent epimerase/dehydratase family protein [Pseudomonadota bacterium]
MNLDLVTGGAGFIGRHLVATLRRRGRSVRVLDRFVPDDMPSDVDMVQGSITDPDTVAHAVTGAERVFHVAGNPELWDRAPDTFDSTNRAGAECVFEAAAKAGVVRLVLTSTHAIQVRGEMPGPYTRAKQAAEQAALERAGRGEPIVIVRPTMPIGPDDRNLTPPTRMLLDFLNGRHPAFLEFETNLIDVREVAEGHVLAAERGEPGTAYVLGRHALMMSALLDELRRLTGLPMARLRVPYPLALLSARVSEALAGLTGAPPAGSVEAVRLARALLPVERDPAAALDLPAWPLEAALRDTIRWLDRAGHLTRRPRIGP